MSYYKIEKRRRGASFLFYGYRLVMNRMMGGMMMNRVMMMMMCRMVYRVVHWWSVGLRRHRHSCHSY
jgi:hypothetical protein